jgi:surfeit locus 1 family protein
MRGEASGPARPRARRIAIAVVAAVVAVTCVTLGLWQLRRLDDRRASNDRITRVLSEPAVRITTSPADETPVPYRRVRAAGTYDTDREVLVFGRSLGGEPGHHVVTPLVLDDGSAVLVVRGWVPFRMRDVPVTGAAPIAREVAVEGFFVPDEGDGSVAPDGRRIVRLLDVEGIGTSLPYDVFPLAVQLRRQTPAQPDLPRPVPEPERSEGPHLSYAIQWFSFAAVALVGAAILIGRERRSD